MAKNFKSELVACFGQPVAENPTGEMQEAAFQKAGMAWRYLTIEVSPENLEAAVNGARAMGWPAIIESTEAVFARVLEGFAPVDA
jgi:shikimate dehydrogenase